MAKLKHKKYEPIIGLLALLIVSFWAFVQYDGLGQVQKIWDNLFPVKSAFVVKEKEATEKNNPNQNCTRAYSTSQKKFIDICKTRAEELADCSKNSREKLTEISGSLKSISDYEKTRELLMKTCMEEAGFDY